MKIENPKQDIVCIYHANCNDGFGAAWVVNLYFGEGQVDFIPMNYGDALDLTKVRNKKVYIVDFSFPKNILLDLAKVADRVILLDHHKTARDDLQELQANSALCNLFDLDIIFDMKKSGAEITWEYFFPNARKPQIIRMIADRDLWKFEISETKRFHEGLVSYPRTFEAWDLLAESANGEMESLIYKGEILIEYRDRCIDSILKSNTKIMRIGGFDILAVNAPYIFASEIGNIMAKGSNTFVAIWSMDCNGEYQFSLRSDKMGLDVGEIAKQYGGGGHKNAAGFTVASLADLNPIIDCSQPSESPDEIAGD